MPTNKFCPAPWVNLSTDVNGSLRPCCRFAQPQHQTEHKMPFMTDGPLDKLWTGPAFTKLRQAFLDGEEPKECSWCWDEEKAGVSSYRQNLIKYHPHIHKKVDFDNPEQPLVIDFKLSNVCNFKCRMCTPMASSLIAKEMGIKQPYWLENKIFGTDNEDIFKRWLPEIEKIEMTGGEPLVNSENRKMLEYMVASGDCKHIDLQITTNCSIYSDEFASLLKEFRMVNIALSIDDLGPRLEYARHGAKWPVIESNMRKWDSNFAFVTVYCTVNNYNIWYLAQILDYFQGEIGKVSLGILHEPEYLSIKYLPREVKNEIVTRYALMPELDVVTDFLESTMGEDDHRLQEFLIETRKLDKTRGEFFETTFPEWVDVLYAM